MSQYCNLCGSEGLLAPVPSITLGTAYLCHECFTMVDAHDKKEK